MIGPQELRASYRGSILALSGFLGAMFLSGCGPGYPTAEDEVAAAASGEVLVKFRRTVEETSRAKSLRAAGLQETARFGLVPGLSVAEVPAGSSAEAVVDALAADPNVLYAEPNYILTADIFPNDPNFLALYGLNNSGQTGGRVDADIDAPEAWDLETGNDVVIAVIDTGVDYRHPDLAANIWTNSGEVPGNGRDDDGNGFVDDVRGWDFSDNDNDPMDENRHGTHVAGTIAAVGNNGVGVAGINWSAKIMPLKFMNARGSGTTAGAIRALQYAVANGAKVSNASWGGGAFSRALFDAISAANADGHVFVAAAGNDGANTDNVPHYPSGYDLGNVISVTATDDTDRRATFGNYGRVTVDLGAPGVSIRSTLPGNSYGNLSGTSMAAPHVAGVVGLLFARNPNLTVSAVRAALLNNTDPVNSLNGLTVTGGRLNAFRAVSSISGGAVQPPQQPTPTQPLGLDRSSANLTEGTTLQLNASGGVAPYNWTAGNSQVATVNSTGRVTAIGPGSTAVTVSDNGGNSASAVISVVSAPVVNVSIQVPQSSLQVNQTIQLQATGGTAPYQWRSSNTAVATVTNNGALTGIAQGTVTITATDAGGNSGSSISIQVTAPPPAGGSGGSLTVQPNANAVTTFNTISVTVSGGSGNYQWSLSNPNAGSIFPDRRRPGVAWFTASSAVGATTTVIATDAGGAQGESGAIEIRPVSAGH